jgi:hypothetical protein
MYNLKRCFAVIKSENFGIDWEDSLEHEQPIFTNDFKEAVEYFKKNIPLGGSVHEETEEDFSYINGRNRYSNCIFEVREINPILGILLHISVNKNDIEELKNLAYRSEYSIFFNSELEMCVRGEYVESYYGATEDKIIRKEFVVPNDMFKIFFG